ncbi:hypothetical protein [Methanonatronarchaeum thermophilum]|uniref:hypothetical protein n=1 Tax=Methanonatronarchaeum thermophilum TaxID=1927129 RepID=UPI00117AC85A|nr:hypothetical protein [Methanonatronarchaeum thermophilum]
MKGETHISRKDLKEEIRLLDEGFDKLVLEGSESREKIQLVNFWFKLSFFLLRTILVRLFYTKKIELLEKAKEKEIEVFRTRKSNYEIVENTPFLVKILSQ